MKNVSGEYDRLNGWNWTLQAAWYVLYVFIICVLWTKPTIWLLILSFTQNVVRACSMFYPYEGYRSATFLDAEKRLFMNRAIFLIRTTNWGPSECLTANSTITTLQLTGMLLTCTWYARAQDRGRTRSHLTLCCFTLLSLDIRRSLQQSPYTFPDVAICATFLSGCLKDGVNCLEGWEFTLLGQWVSFL